MIKTNKKKIYKSISTAIFLVIFAVLCFLLASTIISLAQGKPPSVFGYSFMHVKTESMEDAIPRKTIIMVKILDEDDIQNLKVGDIVTYNSVISGRPATITHRIIEIDWEKGQITTMGDNNPDEDKPISPNSIIAKHVCNVGFLTWFYNVLTSKLGFILIIFVPCLLLLASYIFSIVKNIILIKTKKIEDDKIKELEEKIRKEILEKQNLVIENQQNKNEENK